jgi:alkylated DNA repair dioxygenase AlkB
MFIQGSLLGAAAPDADRGFATLVRHRLDERCWIDHAPEWLAGHDAVFDELFRDQPWQQRTVTMYDRRLPEPRLTRWWRTGDGDPPLPLLDELRRLLGERYDEEFDSIGLNLYRDGSDSVAWHGDRHRHTQIDPIVGIVSVGARRPFRLRPRPPAGGRTARTFELGGGDLLVMGGACQHDWEHTVPKVRTAGPRISITFRHGE